MVKSSTEKGTPFSAKSMTNLVPTMTAQRVKVLVHNNTPASRFSFWTSQKA
jgi:hypothetical protein